MRGVESSISLTLDNSLRGGSSLAIKLIAITIIFLLLI